MFRIIIFSFFLFSCKPDFQTSIVPVEGERFSDENTSPVLKTINNQTIEAGKLLTLFINGVDKEKDVLTYKMSGELAVGMKLTGNQFTFSPTAKEVGSYKVKFSLSDGNSVDSQVVTVVVKEPVIKNNRPVLKYLGNQTAVVGSELVINLIATDLDKDKLTYSIMALPEGAALFDNLNINGNIITYSPKSKPSKPISIRVKVSDSIDEDHEDININIKATKDELILNAVDFNTIKDVKFGLVYARVARDKEPLEVTNTKTGIKQTLTNLSMYDRLPEVSFKTFGMNAPGQLVYLDSAGVEHIIYDCCQDATCIEPKLDADGYACLPMDPSVSFDGKEVIFSVLSRPYAKSRIYQNEPARRVGQLLSGKKGHAKIMRYNLVTNTMTQDWGAVEGIFDMSPVYLPLKPGDPESKRNIMFTSTRSKNSRTKHRRLSKPGQNTLQLWKSVKDGTSAYRTGHHDVDSSLHPYVLSSGNLLYSSWILNGAIPYHHGNGSKTGFTTLANLFWGISVDQHGGNYNSILGAHLGHNAIYSTPDELDYYFTKDRAKNKTQYFSAKAIHFFGELSGGWNCTGNYYRGNNLGGGDIACWEPESEGIEGPYFPEATKAGRVFTPRKIVKVSLWATSSDAFSQKRDDGSYMGKLRDPEGFLGNHLLLTYMQGPCSVVYGQASLAKNNFPEAGCDVGIFQTTKLPSQDPKDLKLVVNSPNFHEFMGRLVMPYKERYAIDEPKYQDVSGKRDAKDRCILATSSMQTETLSFHSHKGLDDPFDRTICGNQGCRLEKIDMAEVKALRFWKVNPNLEPFSDFNQDDQLYHNVIPGNKMEVLGDVELLADNSMAVELPCNVPYVMGGIDKNGLTVLRDQIPQSLRQGEIRTCTGCHLHSTQGPDIKNSLAFKDLNNIPVLGQNNIAGVIQTRSQLEVQKIDRPIMMDGKLENINSAPITYDFRDDVMPILKNKCASCHGNSVSKAGLNLEIPGHAKNTSYERVVWDASQSHVLDANKHTMIKEKNPVHKFIIPRPYTSKYIHGSFARKSLFYWKAANKRTDGRVDSTLPDDIDFGPNHPTTLTKEELGVIGSWIDAGAFISK